MDLSALASYLPKSLKEYSSLRKDEAQANFNRLFEAVAPHCFVQSELDSLKLASSSKLNALQRSSTDYTQELRRAGLSLVSAGSDGLAALRVIAKCTRAVNSAEDPGHAQDSTSKALGLLLKSYLFLDLKELGPEVFKRKYSEHRKHQDGHFPVDNPVKFVHQLALPGGFVALDQQLLAIVGGLIGVDFQLLRVRKDDTVRIGTHTTIERLSVEADPVALKQAARFQSRGSALQSMPRPVILLLQTVETAARRCVFYGLKREPDVIQEASNQVTDWWGAEDLKIWLPSPASRSVPISRLYNVDYEASDVVWTVVTLGRDTLVLQKKQYNRHGQLVTDPYFGDMPVAERVMEAGRRVVRLLKRRGQPTEEADQLQDQELVGAPAGDAAAAGAGPSQPPPPVAATQAVALRQGVQMRDLHIPQTGPTEMEVDWAPQQFQQYCGEQQQQQAPPPHQVIGPLFAAANANADAASAEAVARVADHTAMLVAQRIGQCHDISRLALEHEVQGESHKSAIETATALLQAAAEVENLASSRTMTHLVVVSNAGSGKTTFINKTIAELMATPDTLRSVLPPELHGPLNPSKELPSDYNRFLELFGLVDEGVRGIVVANAGGESGSAVASTGNTAPPLPAGSGCNGVQPLRRFSASIRHGLPVLGSSLESAASCSPKPTDTRFMTGGEFDFFDLSQHAVSEDVEVHLMCGWDEQATVVDAARKYNRCKPRAHGQEYGCFMPNGQDTHCTDRMQNVYMPVADRLDTAAFRFHLHFPSHEAANWHIYQYRRFIMGEITYNELSQLAPEAYTNVPLMCGRNLEDSSEVFEKLLAKATMPNEDLRDNDSDSDTEMYCDDNEAARDKARQLLLSQLFPLQRYKAWLGRTVEFQLLTDDTVGASKWAEFFSTRFILGNENAAFAVSGGAAMHVPSEGLPLHIMDLPGVDQLSNALHAQELQTGLRAILENAGQGHTVIVLPATAREANILPVISALRESRVLQEAITAPDNFTLVPVVNLRPGSDVVAGLGDEDMDANKFAAAYDKMRFYTGYHKNYRNQLLETAADISLSKDIVRKLLKEGQLLRTFVLDVGGMIVETRPFRSHPKAAACLFSTFVRFVEERHNHTIKATRHAARAHMWKELAGMAFEGLGLAKRLHGGMQGPSSAAGGNNDTDLQSDDEADATSQLDSVRNLRKVTKALKEVLNLQADLSAGVGTSEWETEVKKLGAGVSTSLGPPATVLEPADEDLEPADEDSEQDTEDSVPPPLTLDGVQKWVEGPKSRLRVLLDKCTPEKAKEQLSQKGWPDLYKEAYKRDLGNHLTSNDLCATNLPKYLLSEFYERGETIVAGMLKQLLTTIMDTDIKLVQAQIGRTRQTIERYNVALLSDKEVQLLLDVFNESIIEMFNRKKEEVLKQFKQKSKARLLTCWRDAINNKEAREAAAAVYRETVRRSRTKRLEKARTQLLEEWKASLMPPVECEGRPGHVARIVVDLARNLLQLYRRSRMKVISQAMEAARSSTVPVLGPIALHVVRAGLEAAVLIADASLRSAASEPLLKELQAALQKAKDTKRARVQMLHDGYELMDPLDLVKTASEDTGLRVWVRNQGEEAAVDAGRA